MKSQFVVTISGKEAVLYAGLLDLAHEKGLKSIRTFIVQMPSPENGGVAVVTAEVVMANDQVFTGIGDASKENTSGPMQKAIIRFAETRAKARALRDAVNIGTAAAEEMDEHTNGRRARSSSPAAAPAAMPINNTGAQCPACHCPSGVKHAPTCTGVRVKPSDVDPETGEVKGAALHVEEGFKSASPSQLTAIRNMCRKAGLDADATAQEWHKSQLDQLSYLHASNMITRLGKLGAQR